jgi:hypothetical protein
MYNKPELRLVGGAASVVLGIPPGPFDAVNGREDEETPLGITLGLDD